MRRWGYRVRLWWCPNCNVPLRQDTCGRCGARGVEVRFSDPSDIRPAFKGDIQLIKEAMKREFGSDELMKELGIGEWRTYLNRTAYVDDMKEVIVGAVVVGRLFFDPMRLSWRWRLSAYSLPIAAEKDLVRKFVVDKAKPLQILGEGGEEGEQAAVLDRSGNVIGLAISKRGRFRVQVVYRGAEREEPYSGNPSFEDLAKANEFRLRWMVSKAIKRVSVLAERTGLPVVVSYSGGKDSLVALDLTVRAGIEPVMLFNNTGLELPETIENVYKVADMYGLKLIVADAGDRFWEAVSKFSPPAKEFRWCCKVVKMAPIGRVYKEHFPDGALVIIGQRALESIDRSWSGGVWRNRWLPTSLNVSPIQEWDLLTEWIYILKNKLPVNKLYFMGFERLGCFMCPASPIAEYSLIQKVYPDLWEKWEAVLREWRKKLPVGEEWVRYHLWRWLSPLAQGRRRVEIWLGIKKARDWREEYSARAGIRVEGVEKDDDTLRVRLSRPLPVEGITEQAKVLGPDATIREADGGVEVRVGRARLTIKGSELVAESPSRREREETLFTALKLAVRWERCAGCGNCVTWCPTGAISIEGGKPRVDGGKCISCGVCVEVCPMSEVFTEKLIVSQIVGSHKGRPRKPSSASITLYKSKRQAEAAETKEAEAHEIGAFIDSLDAPQ